MTARPRGGVPFEVTDRHMRMAHTVLAKRRYYRHTTIDYDDHVGACLLGLAKAFKSYDPSRGAAFESYAYRRMVGEHLDYLRTMDHLTRSGRADVRDGLAVDPGPPVVLPGTWDPPELVDDHGLVELRDALDRAEHVLTAKEATAMRLCEVHGWTMADVGVLLDVSESRVCQLKRQARDKLRAELGPVMADAA
jgi:RNA polymerase sigma factor for flagellar operon FliA